MLGKSKKAIIQANQAMKKEDIAELEKELSEKFECKVIILPISVNAMSLQIIK